MLGSATIVHGLLADLDADMRVLLWNTVPTHPHRPGDRLSNRGPSAVERRCGVTYACRIIEAVDPQEVVAIGRVAERTLKRELSREVHYVRHPANGGADKFR
ncbi:MAG: uracil-DNA glycosylase, partial [Thermoleophilia bacterium]|nr:uracil-DNA glycosylase [Thermoleophilia bacterium]